MFGYLLRTVLQRVVLDALRIQQGHPLQLTVLKPSECISFESYEQASSSYLAELAVRISGWKQELHCFSVLTDECLQHGHSIFCSDYTEMTIEKLKHQWDTMDPQVKKDFESRVQAEEHLIEMLQKGVAEYEPCNYYSRFLKH